ncbi:MAG: hypothetical protein QOE70_2528 [Chthoniobacter sp.]|jgi:hypothetical protein|nr:hypothetical protein [Chthoniobacter sp.]
MRQAIPTLSARWLATIQPLKSQMTVSVRNVTPSHVFGVEVASIVEGTMTSDKNGRASIRFRTPPPKGQPVLDFDPRGETLRILDGATSVLEGVVSGAGEDNGRVIGERAELSPDDAPANAKGHVSYTVSAKGRRTFRVDLSNITGGPLHVHVEGIERGEVHQRGKSGVLIFDSAPTRDGVLPLTFDPRGSHVDILSDDNRVVFTGEAEAEGRGVNVAAPSDKSQLITSTGADADATAVARLRIDSRARKHFSVEIEDVPAGSYNLLVDGAVVGAIQVAAVTGGTKGEIEFTGGDDDPNELPLTFDPIGKTLAIAQNATKFFEGAFDPNISGGGSPAAEPASQIDESLASTGLDADAHAEARYEVDNRGRHKFSVEIEDVDAGSYTLSVAGIVRGTISAKLVNGKVKGELEFESEQEPGHKLLNFDPRGQTIEITSSVGTFFSHLFGNGSAAGGGAVTPFDVTVALISSGADNDATAKAELKQSETGDRGFEVEIEDVAVGNYDLLVGGTVRGSIAVAAVSHGTRGKLEFESEPNAGQPALNFEVESQQVVIQQGSTVFFSRTFPTQ